MACNRFNTLSVSFYLECICPYHYNDNSRKNRFYRRSEKTNYKGFSACLFQVIKGYVKANSCETYSKENLKKLLAKNGSVVLRENAELIEGNHRKEP